MRILFIGDPHLKITRFDLAKKFLLWLNQTIEATKPDLVVNLGDTFDTHAVLRSEVMTEFFNHVNYVRSLSIPYIYLLGNHDMYKPNDAKYHALLPFKGEIEGFTVVDEISELYGITFVPYQHDISKFPSSTSDVCVAHQTFKGADFGDITTKEGVDANSISASIIVSGHIHKRQTLIQGKLIYVGSPFPQSITDINEVKGLTVLDTDTYKQEFHQCPLPMWRHIEYILGQDLSTADVHQDLLQLLPGSQDHWTVEITGPTAEIKGYQNSTEYKKMVSGIDVKIKSHFIDKDKRQVKIKALSMENIVSEYVVKVYAGSLDRVELENKAIEVLNATRHGQ